jgi:ubiquinone/menaquinone biosynthesis C-methylase UbiE
MTAKFTQTMLANLVLDSSWRALEIGAGTGLVGLSVLDRVKSMVFVDTSEAMLAVLREKTILSPLKSKVEVLHAEVYEYQKQDIDFVFACMSLHHIPDLESTIDHLSKITNPNAKLIIGDLRTEDGSFHHYEPIAHKGFDTNELSLLLNNAGFEVQTVLDYNIISKEIDPGVVHDYQQFMLIARKL